MSRAKKTNLAASVKARLMQLALDTDQSYAELLRLYVMERFLYRLSQSDYADQFVLKGALLFAVWGDFPRRTTMDIDLLGFSENSLDAMEALVKAICILPVSHDGVVFDPASVKAVRIKENADYEGVRITLIAFLERTRQPVQMDVAFGDSLFPGAVERQFPVLLDFPAPSLRCYHPLTALAEKFEAMVKLGFLNSRMKDFYDVRTILQAGSFPAQEVRQVCVKTFARRGTAFEVHGDLFTEAFANSTEKQTQWSAFCRKQRLEGSAPSLFRDVVHELHQFFIPLMEQNE